MPTRREEASLAGRHGRWGEDVAAEHLRLKGWTVLERNANPLDRDRRLELDIVAYDPTADAIVFVEVKQNSRHVPGECRLRRINRRKRDLLRRACHAWRHRHRWSGSYRFDVVEVYGRPGCRRVEIDHIQSVNLFQTRERFVNWSN